MQAPVGEQAEGSGARAALAELLPELRAFARFLTASRAEADDVVQEALLRMLRAEERFEPGTNLRAWAFTILRNAFYEGRRRRRRETARLEAHPAPETDMQAPQEAQAGMRDLARGLAALPPSLREAIVLVGAQGLSYEEAAAVCAVPVGTMKARVSRARQRLARSLDRVTA
jgi:RNA polymerase sigma-70 factor (ECF subfamily)